eukprot:2806699-Prymnesium_polylepis.1
MPTPSSTLPMSIAGKGAQSSSPPTCGRLSAALVAPTARAIRRTIACPNACEHHATCRTVMRFSAAARDLHPPRVGEIVVHSGHIVLQLLPRARRRSLVERSARAGATPSRPRFQTSAHRTDPRRAARPGG